MGNSRLSVTERPGGGFGTERTPPIEINFVLPGKNKHCSKASTTGTSLSN